MRVRHKKTEKEGTTCPDFMNCCADQETPVVWDGTDFFSGTYTDNLEVLGPENAVVDENCRIGRGADCCVFAILSPSGFKCKRFGRLRSIILNIEEIAAQRRPKAPYPDCKLSQ